MNVGIAMDARCDLGHASKNVQSQTLERQAPRARRPWFSRLSRDRLAPEGDDLQLRDEPNRHRLRDHERVTDARAAPVLAQLNS
jgi:hypothetical protein